MILYIFIYYSRMLNREQLILACIISVIIFFYSLELSSFSGYTLIGLVVFGILLYFGVYEIFKSGRSVTSMVIMSIVGIIILVIGLSGYTVYVNKQKINKQWPQYRCKPYILPFAGWAVGPSGVSATSNFTNCMWSINKSFFDILISPFTDILKIITGILGSIVADIQNIRKMITYMRDNIEEIARDTQQKIWDSYERIAFLFKTILNIFEKLGQVFKNMFEMMLYTFYTLASLWNGPIGGVANFFCFDEDTFINLNNNEKKKIKDIKVGDYLEDSNMVKAVLKFNAENIDMYRYNNIYVSGEHIVKENEEWIKIKDISRAKKVDYHKDFIYCLITENSQIKIGDKIFSDYIQIKDQDISNNIYQYIIQKLNNNSYILLNRDTRLDSGLDGDTQIMVNNKYKKIKTVEINDITEYGRILGVIELSYDKEDIYMYQNIVMSGNTIINIDGKWVPIYMVDGAKNIRYNKNLYHIITENGMINVNNLIIRDFEQINDKNINEAFDNYVLDRLNKRVTFFS